MVFVHCSVFLFTKCAVAVAEDFDTVKVCCKTVVTCVEPKECHCLFSRFVFVVLPCEFDVSPLCVAR